MPLTLAPSRTTHQQQERQSAQRFIHNLSQRHSQVATALQAAQDRAKQRHDRQHTPLFFQPRDRIWLLFTKNRFQGHHHKLHPL